MKEIQILFGGQYYREKLGCWLGLSITLFVELCLYFLPPDAGVLYLAFVHLGTSSTAEIIFLMSVGIILGGAGGAFLGYLVRKCDACFKNNTEEGVVRNRSDSTIEVDETPEEETHLLTNGRDEKIYNTKKTNLSRGIKIKDATVYFSEEDIPTDEKETYIARLKALYTDTLEPIYGDLFFTLEQDIVPSEIVSGYWSFVGNYNFNKREAEKAVHGISFFKEQDIINAEYMDAFKIALHKTHVERHKNLRTSIPQAHIDHYYKAKTLT